MSMGTLTALKDQIKTAHQQGLLLALGFFLAFISLLAGFLTWAPAVEVNLFPPVRDVSHSDVMRIGRALCWNLNFRKVRNIVPIQNFYWVNYGVNGVKRDAVSVTLDGHALPVPLPVQADANRLVTLGIFCADLPMENGQVIVDATARPATLETIIVYRPHFLWNLLMAHPPIAIPKEPLPTPLNKPPTFRLQSVPSK